MSAVELAQIEYLRGVVERLVEHLSILENRIVDLETDTETDTDSDR